MGENPTLRLSPNEATPKDAGRGEIWVRNTLDVRTTRRKLRAACEFAMPADIDTNRASPAWYSGPSTPTGAATTLLNVAGFYRPARLAAVRSTSQQR